MSNIEVIAYCLFTWSLGKNKQCYHSCRSTVIRYTQISGVRLYGKVCSDKWALYTT